MWMRVVFLSLVHWDVNNENEHGRWFERNTSHPDLLVDMFVRSYLRAPDVLMFLNDFSIVREPANTLQVMTPSIHKQRIEFKKKQQSILFLVVR